MVTALDTALHLPRDPVIAIGSRHCALFGRYSYLQTMTDSSSRLAVQGFKGFEVYLNGY